MDVLLIFLPKFSSKHFNTLRFQHARRAISTLIHWSKIFYIHVNFQPIKVCSRQSNCEANLHACWILNIKLKRLADNPIKSTLSRSQKQKICCFTSTSCRWQYRFASMSFSTISELAHVSSCTCVQSVHYCDASVVIQSHIFCGQKTFSC